MRKILLPLLFLSPLFLNAQFNIGYNKYNKFRKVKSIKEEQIKILRETTTVFILPDRDTANREEFEKSIKSIWTITPIKVATAREIKLYSDKTQYSIFKFRYEKISVEVSSHGSSGHTGARSTSLYLGYELWITDRPKKKKLKSHVIAGVELYPDVALFKALYAKGSTNNLGVRSEDFTTKLIKDYTIYNWGPGFLKGYLKTIQDCVLAQKKRDPMYGVADNERLTALRNDTLYVPDYVLIKYNPFGITEKETELDDESLVNAYPYPIKYVPADVLNKMILDRSKPIKYLVFTKSSSQKIVNVYDSKDNAIIYATTKNASYKFKYKDLKKLRKEIES